MREMIVDKRIFPATGMPDQDWWGTHFVPDPDAVVKALGIAPRMVVIDPQ